MEENKDNKYLLNNLSKEIGESKGIKKISTLTEYLSYLKDYLSDNKMYGFRGQPENYNNYVPNLFRDDSYKKNEHYEKNILDKLRSFDTKEYNNDYLITAIEAQHGGLKTRLLDISYSALIALHFAVTPNFQNKINSYDDKDGEVYIFEIDKIVQPTNADLINYYEQLISGEFEQLESRNLEHLFIDTFNKNKRIAAQQGAFIMFCGKKYQELPIHMVQHILIDAKNKKNIRNELKKFFGISNGFVYPELQNNANSFSEDYTNNFYETNIFREDTLDKFKYSVISKFVEEIEITAKYIKDISKKDSKFEKFPRKILESIDDAMEHDKYTFFNISTECNDPELSKINKLIHILTVLEHNRKYDIECFVKEKINNNDSNHKNNSEEIKEKSQELLNSFISSINNLNINLEHYLNEKYKEKISSYDSNGRIEIPRI